MEGDGRGGRRYGRGPGAILISKDKAEAGLA
jgi:hypothetical protein